MRSFLVVFGAMAVVGMGAAYQSDQAPGHISHKGVTSKPVVTTPVTQAEAHATFARSEAILRKALGMPTATDRVGIPSTAAPVHRSQVVAEMTRLLSVFDSKVKMTPRAVAFDPTVLRLAERSQVPNLRKLVNLGAVGRVSPLATGPKETITTSDFGDAVGFFVARIAQITHMPSNKWTPWLRSEDQ